MNGQRLTEQLQLVFTPAEEGTPSPVVEGDAEPDVAKCEPERPAVTNSLMEAVCERENLKKALRRVKANKGSPGIDGMTVEQLPEYLVTGSDLYRREKSGITDACLAHASRSQQNRPRSCDKKLCGCERHWSDRSATARGSSEKTPG